MGADFAEHRRVLQLPEGAGRGTLRAAYHRIARAVHPDCIDTESGQRFRRVRAAYEELRRVSGAGHRAHELSIEVEQAIFGDAVSTKLPVPGRVQPRRVRIEVPQGAAPGDVIQAVVPGQGPCLFRIRIKPHPHFRVEGEDIHVLHPVDAATFYLGGRTRVQTPWGGAEVDVQPGVAEAAVAGHGLRRIGESARGVAIVHFVPIVRGPHDVGLRRALLWAGLDEAGNPGDCLLDDPGGLQPVIAWTAPPLEPQHCQLSRSEVAGVAAPKGALRAEVFVPLGVVVRGGTVPVVLHRGRDEKTIDVRVPAGIRPDATVRLRDVRLGARREPVFLSIRSQDHGGARREEDDIVVPLVVSAAQAYGGTLVALDTPWGCERVELPPGTADGAQLRLTGHGVRSSRGAGDLVATVLVRWPNPGSAYLETVLRRRRPEH